MANYLKPEKVLAVINCLLEGCSVRSVERLVGVHRDTILRQLVKAAGRCQEIMDRYVRDVDCYSIQTDEIWSFIYKKQARLKEEDLLRHPERGDQYTFVGMCADSKLVIAHTTGKRNAATTTRFIQDLASRLNGNRPQIATDGYEPYRDIIEDQFGYDGVDYGQLIKNYVSQYPGRGRYSPPRVSGTVKRKVMGDPTEGDISTSYVERQNLTMRMQMRRFTRLTNAFSKKLKNLKAAVSLHFAHYNFCRIHQSLQVTPAMAAGLTDHVWDLSELLGLEPAVVAQAA